MGPNAYAATGSLRPIQCMDRPPLSTSGSTPKCFRNEFAQLSRDGRGRFWQQLQDRYFAKYSGFTFFAHPCFAILRIHLNAHFMAPDAMDNGF